MDETWQTEVRSCTWRSDAVSIVFDGGYPRTLSWSPSGRYIALVMQTEGVWLLDMETYLFSSLPSNRRDWWLRPTWGPDDDMLFLSTPMAMHQMVRRNNVWEEIGVQRSNNVRWAERVECAGCVGAGVEADHSVLLCADLPLTSATVISPYLPTGDRLEFCPGEYPAWWRLGESAVVVGLTRKTLGTYVVELASGIATPLSICDDSLTHQLTRSSTRPIVVGLETDDRSYPIGKRNQRLVALDADRAVKYQLGPLPELGCDRVIATSPDAGKIALIEGDFTLTILSVVIA
jgi:hypothetical protein